MMGNETNDDGLAPEDPGLLRLLGKITLLLWPILLIVAVWSLIYFDIVVLDFHLSIGAAQ